MRYVFALLAVLLTVLGLLLLMGAGAVTHEMVAVGLLIIAAVLAAGSGIMFEVRRLRPDAQPTHTAKPDPHRYPPQ